MGPNDALALEYLANVARRLQHWDTAVAAIRRVVLLDPGNRQFRGALIVVLAHRTDYDAAIDTAGEATQRFPEAESFHFWHAKLVVKRTGDVPLIRRCSRIFYQVVGFAIVGSSVESSLMPNRHSHGSKRQIQPPMIRWAYLTRTAQPVSFCWLDVRRNVRVLDSKLPIPDILLGMKLCLRSNHRPGTSSRGWAV